MKNKEVYVKAIETFGDEAQTLKAIEEMSELIKELCKGHDVMHIAEEIADVEIMCDQLKIIFNCPLTVNMWKDEKIKRLKKKLGL